MPQSRTPVLDAYRSRRDPQAYERWRELYMKREEMGPEADHSKIAPLEHGAYAESRVREQPILGPIEQLLAIPGYNMARALGLMDTWSPVTLDDMAESYRGLGRGVGANVGDLLTWFLGDNPPTRPGGRVKHKEEDLGPYGP